ncbi:MAG: hypothetical protein ACOCP4_06740 [Candidatus Woesearchaeota archaeon]
MSNKRDDLDDRVDYILDKIQKDRVKNIYSYSRRYSSKLNELKDNETLLKMKRATAYCYGCKSFLSMGYDDYCLNNDTIKKYLVKKTVDILKYKINNDF